MLVKVPTLFLFLLWVASCRAKAQPHPQQLGLRERLLALAQGIHLPRLPLHRYNSLEYQGGDKLSQDTNLV